MSILASTGNVCTVRCINEQEVGGCFAVQQTDTTALDGNNSPGNINTAQAADGITKQIAQNKQDLAAAEQAIASSPDTALTDEGKQNAAVVAAIMSADPATSSSTATTNTTSSKKGKGSSSKTQGTKNNNNKRTSSNPRRARIRSYDELTEE
jgi:hypothetical protein